MSVLEAPPVKDGVLVRVLPYKDDVDNVKGDLIDNLLRCARRHPGSRTPPAALRR